MIFMRFMDKMERSLSELRTTKEKNDFLLEEINKIIEENGWTLVTKKKISESLIDIGETPKEEFHYSSPFGKLKLKALYLPTGVGITYETLEGEKETRFLIRKYIYDVEGKPILINRNALVVNIKQMLEKCKILRAGWEEKEKFEEAIKESKEIFEIKGEKVEEKKDLTPCPNCGELLEDYWKSCPICRTILK